MLTLRLLCLARVRGGVSSLFSVLSVFGLFLIEDRKIFRGKIYNYLNCSILFLIKKLMLPHRNHPEPDLLHVLHLKIHPHQINNNS